MINSDKITEAVQLVIGIVFLMVVILLITMFMDSSGKQTQATPTPVSSAIAPSSAPVPIYPDTSGKGA